MLRDAETTSIAERMRRLPVGGDAFSRRRGGGLAFFFFSRVYSLQAVRKFGKEAIKMATPGISPLSSYH